jgi:hypothetical protein
MSFCPFSYKIVAGIAGNSKAVTIGGLNPETLYELSITAFRKGEKFSSEPIVFRTLKEMSAIVSVEKTNVTTSEPILSPHIDNTISPNSSSSLFSVEYNNATIANNVTVTTRGLPTVSL